MMAKFMVLYNSDFSASELMENSSPDEVKASMEEWIKWRDEASKKIKVEFGLPLQAVSRIMASGITDSESKASGYSILEGESKEEIIEMLKSHPHLKRHAAYIDLFEMLPLPGV